MKPCTDACDAVKATAHSHFVRNAGIMAGLIFVALATAHDRTRVHHR